MKTIKELPRSKRPRERLLSFGANNLTEIELIAVILGVGTKQQSVLEITSNLMHRFSLKDIAQLNVVQLQDATQIGFTHVSKILAAIELGKRLLPPPESQCIHTPQDAINQVNEIRTKQQEYMIGLYLDARNQLLEKQILAIGKQNQAAIDLRDVFRPAMSLPASYLIVIHNHPSGNPTPSQEDIQFTRRLKEVGEMLGVILVDHLIVSRDSFSSFNQLQLIT